MARTALCALLIAVCVSGELCYEPDQAEFAILHNTACDPKGSRLKIYINNTYVDSLETASRDSCQRHCHETKECAAFEWSPYDAKELKTRPVPECFFFRRAENHVPQDNTLCFVKSDVGAYKFCGMAGETCTECYTSARFGRDGAWHHKMMPAGGNGKFECTADFFGVATEGGSYECQCSAHSGLTLLLNAANYAGGNEWMDESPLGHHAVLVREGLKSVDSAPTHVAARGRTPAHFTFDGEDDYLALENMYFPRNEGDRLKGFTVSVKFRTTWGRDKPESAFSNWALVDFDRSEFFSLYVRGDNGKIGFSTSGGSTHDLEGQNAVNDGNWHWVTCTFSAEQGMKAIYVDGVQDRQYTKKGLHDKGVGSSKTRYGVIGEGSEGSKMFAKGNGVFYHGDIAHVELYTSIVMGAPIGDTTEERAIDNQRDCEAAFLGSCQWSQPSIPEDTYYMGHLDEEGSAKVLTAGTESMVLWSGLSLGNTAGWNRTTVILTIEEGCEKEKDATGDFLVVPDMPGLSKEEMGCDIILRASTSMDVASWERVLRSVQFGTKSNRFHDRKVTAVFGEHPLLTETMSTYQYFDEEVSWAEAKDRCAMKGGHLATVTSYIEDDFIADRVPKSGAWLGASDANEEGKWTWATGPEEGRVIGVGRKELFFSEEEEYYNWRSGQPDYSRASALRTVKGEWIDEGIDSRRTGYVCEWDVGHMQGDRFVSTRVHMQGCMRKPCNHMKSWACRKEQGCEWSSKGGFCYQECEPNYYTELCNVYCHAMTTCSGHGRCGDNGACICDKEWGGPGCRYKRYSCRAWGDPHYTGFDGKKFDFHGIPKPPAQPGVYTVYKNAEYEVNALHYRCSGSVNYPIGCMKQVKFSEAVDTDPVSVEINVAFDGNTERGMVHVNNASCPTGCVIDVAKARDEGRLPLFFGRIALVRVHDATKRRTEYNFELPGKRDQHVAVRIVQDNSWKAPYMNVVVDHFGSLSGVTGLCHESCESTTSRTGWGKDCTDALEEKVTCKKRCGFKTEVKETDIPWCQGRSIAEGGCGVDGQCENNQAAVSWSKKCCEKYKTCAGNELYEQCVVENCNMGWVTNEGNSHCLDEFNQVFEAVLLEEWLCGRELCPKNRAGPECKVCDKGFFGRDCDIACDAKTTCNGHGTCSPQGKCWCDAGYTYSIPNEGRYCLHVCEAQRMASQCSRKSACRWLQESNECVAKCPQNTFGRDCSRYCKNGETCINGSCDKEGKCVCKKGWGGEQCSVGKYSCVAWGDPHYTPFSRKKYDFFGPGMDAQNNPIFYELYSKDTLHITARHWKCNNRATCMKQFSVWDEFGGSVEIRKDNTVRINCTIYTKEQINTQLQAGDWTVLPRPGKAPLKIVKANDNLYLEVSEETEQPNGDLVKSTYLELKVKGRNKAVDMYLTHYGDPQKEGVKGLCNGKPGSSDDPSLGLGEKGCFADEKCTVKTQPWNHCRTGPPPCAVSSKPKCAPGIPEAECGMCPDAEVDPPPQQWRCGEGNGVVGTDPTNPATKLAENCCARERKCKEDVEGDVTAYEQCMWDECALGSDVGCLENHEMATKFEDQDMEESCACDHRFMAVDQETQECTRCKPFWFDSPAGKCTKRCTATETCNGHGSCSGEGRCVCDPEWEGEGCSRKAPPASRACADQATESSCNSQTGCAWQSDGVCKRSHESGECWHHLTANSCEDMGCYWDDWEDYCTDQAPAGGGWVVTECGAGKEVECKDYFRAVEGLLHERSCYRETCTPPVAGQKVIVNVTGIPSKNPSLENCYAKNAREEGLDITTLCKDGKISILEGNADCTYFDESEVVEDSKGVKLLWIDAYVDKRDTRITEEIHFWEKPSWRLHGYKVCYYPATTQEVEQLDGSFLRIDAIEVDRVCPGNFDLDLEEECTVCKKDWYGERCDRYCTRTLSCSGHGFCKNAGTHEDQCICDEGWMDLDSEEEGTAFRIECYTPTPDMVNRPDYTPTPPTSFKATTAEIRIKHEGCAYDTPYAHCPPPKKGDKVLVNITGVPPPKHLLPCELGFKTCPDGTAMVVKKSGTCSAPAPGEVLIPEFEMTTSTQEHVRLSTELELPFDPFEQQFKVCYRPKISPSPTSVLTDVATKQAGVARGAALEEGGGGGGMSGGAIAALVIVLLALLGVFVAGVIYNRRRQKEGNVGDFSSGKLEELTAKDTSNAADYDGLLDGDDDIDREEP